MNRITRASNHRVADHAGNTRRGRQKRGIEKNVIKTLPAQSNTNSPVKKESKLDNTEKGAIETETSETYSSPAHATHYNQNSNATVRKTKSPMSIAHYLLGNAQVVPTCVQAKDEITSDVKQFKTEIIADVEQFKTDETPVAVPIHGPPTPHRINMPSEDLDDEVECDKKKQSVITLLSPVQVVKKSAPRGRKKATSNQSINRSSKLSSAETNHSITDYFPVRRSVRKSKKVVLEEKQRDLENKVLCQVEEGLTIRNFPGKGRGIVTTQAFAKGEFVVEYIGELIGPGEAKEREETYAQDQNAGCYMYYFQHRNQQYCVDATAESDKLGRLVNHSRNGNLIARIVEVCSTPHLVLTAKEDIPVGVEVSYDYGDRSRESIRHHPWLAL